MEDDLKNGELLPEQHQENIIEKLPDIYNYDFQDPEKPRPWDEHDGADRDKYFNYGFNECTWQAHVESVFNAR